MSRFASRFAWWETLPGRFQRDVWWATFVGAATGRPPHFEFQEEYEDGADHPVQGSAKLTMSFPIQAEAIEKARNNPV